MTSQNNWQGMDSTYTADWQLPFSTPRRAPTLDANGLLHQPFKLDVTSERPESPWLRMQMGQEHTNYNRGLDDLLGQNLAGQAGAYNNLASQGGLSGGAAERLQNSGLRNLSNQQTGLTNQYTDNLRNLRTQDFTNQVNADKWNIGNNLSEVGNQAGYDWSVFDTMAKAYSANQIGDGYDKEASSGKKPKSNTEYVTHHASERAMDPKKWFKSPWGEGQADPSNWKDPRHWTMSTGGGGGGWGGGGGGWGGWG